jgi:hypothetical protein
MNTYWGHSVRIIYNNINWFWRVLLGELTAKMRFSTIQYRPLNVFDLHTAECCTWTAKVLVRNFTFSLKVANTGYKNCTIHVFLDRFCELISVWWQVSANKVTFEFYCPRTVIKLQCTSKYVRFKFFPVFFSLLHGATLFCCCVPYYCDCIYNAFYYRFS